MSWTDERVETLKRMWTEGQSASQIAKELGGVTRNAVIGKVHRLGLSNRVTGAGQGDEGDDEVVDIAAGTARKPEAARPAATAEAPAARAEPSPRAPERSAPAAVGNVTPLPL
ncbi:MAG: GcrA family cell cycle regulator, partial [Pseudomonadota bacterium]